MENLNQEIKKEIQKTIVTAQTNGKATEEEFLAMLKLVSPGTGLRTALEGALKAGKGALIVTENEQLMPLIDGGFRLNCRFTPQRLVELTKMDGAIILSKDLKRVTYANVLLTPDSKIKSSETGTRHKAAERTAKQIESLVIAISERKHEINLFYKNIKYTLKNTDQVLRKAHEYIQIVEKQRELFDKNLEKLSKMEMKNYPSLHQSLTVIQKGRMIQKIEQDIKRQLVELGNEGLLLKTRLKEITSGVEKELNFVLKDYTKLDVKKSKVLLDSLTYDEILDQENILRVLAYENAIQTNPIKGWRILSHTGLAEADIAKVIKSSGSLGKALYSKEINYYEILGEDKASKLASEFEKIKLGN
ncbi:MAG: DNA integrity scanning diadenylate cyclase DisA [Nanoarchaeota archaeon]